VVDTSSFGPFWSFPSQFLTGVAAASGIALINSIGNLGRFVWPYVIGTIAKHTGSTAWGLGLRRRVPDHRGDFGAAPGQAESRL